MKKNNKNKYDLSDENLKFIYSWIDEIPLSRPKTKISRDFSDGILAAEIIKHYHNKLIDLHNYIKCNNKPQKFTNWHTLKKKTFVKLKLNVNDKLLEDIVNCENLAIEYFLFNLKDKLESYEDDSYYENSNLKYNNITNSKIDNTQKKNMNYANLYNENNNYNNSYNNNNKQYYDNDINNYNNLNSISNQNYNKISFTENGYNLKNKSIKELENMIIERDYLIHDLRETLEIVGLKNKKLEELIMIKDNKINSLLENN